MTTPNIDFSKLPSNEKSNKVQLVNNRNAYMSGIGITLKDIPTHLKIKRQLYKIRGAINLIIPSNMDIGTVGHYESYCFREGTGYWELYDDLKNNAKKCNENTHINAEMLIYTV